MTDGAKNPEVVRMKDLQGMPGTPGGLLLHATQFIFAVAAISIMASTSTFSSFTAFRYFVAAVMLQSIWSLSLAILVTDALLMKTCLRNPRIVCLLTIGDGITSTFTFAAACASTGMTVLIGRDLDMCSESHCTSFEIATGMAFITWFAVSPSLLLNFWSLASR